MLMHSLGQIPPRQFSGEGRKGRGKLSAIENICDMMSSECFLVLPQKLQKLVALVRSVCWLSNGEEQLSNIDELRVQKYSQTIAKLPVTASFELSTLPPTRAACHQHSMRTSLQVSSTIYLEAKLRGLIYCLYWKLKDTKMII